MNFLQETLTKLRANHIYTTEDNTTIMGLLTQYPDYKIKTDAPYTHIYTLEPYSVAEADAWITQHAQTGTYVQLFTELDPSEFDEWREQLADMLNIIKHREIAHHNGIKVIQTIGRVGKLVRR